MKKLLFFTLFLMFYFTIYSQTKYTSIYKHSLTHTEIIKETYNNEENFSFVIHGAEMWTGINRSGLIYKGNLKQMHEFIYALDVYVNSHKTPSDTVINNVTISLKKVAGINCISFNCGDFERNTNKKAIKNILKALHEENL